MRLPFLLSDRLKFNSGSYFSYTQAVTSRHLVELTLHLGLLTVLGVVATRPLQPFSEYGFRPLSWFGRNHLLGEFSRLLIDLRHQELFRFCIMSCLGRFRK
ncbi:hypothetical protein FOMG_14908 [Fusarium oxysporum f. sp. melonis 26406]|uniref:Uncharacterized protein n=1 Tax=Fusarium oxysporum f. sp. melonis 26406 TaxID=1089452 RepID=W9ZCK0_FUSOX|nr:hypothetical protein FOMG_14908 [Fusarium oxysporum f. sp. melonis 26406]